MKIVCSTNAPMLVNRGVKAACFASRMSHSGGQLPYHFLWMRRPNHITVLYS